MPYFLQADIPWFQTQLIAGIFAAIIGALVAWLTSFLMEKNKIEKAKKDLVFEFHKEFNNTEMSKNRRTANQLLITFANENGYRDIYNQRSLLNTLPQSSGEDILSLYATMRFFQRLAIAHYHSYLDKSLLNALFQELFYYWHYNVFITLKGEDVNTETQNASNNFNEWTALYEDVDKLATCFRECIINNNSKNNILIEAARQRFSNYVQNETNSESAGFLSLSRGFNILGNILKTKSIDPAGQIDQEYAEISKLFTNLSTAKTQANKVVVADGLIDLASRLKAISQNK